MVSETRRFFDNLERSLDFIKNGKWDNEAQRHANIVLPILTCPYVLGWGLHEIINQAQIPIPKVIQDSYFWRGATPKRRVPDMIIKSEKFEKVVAVIEEKCPQRSLDEMKDHLMQLNETQGLCNSVWGILTDGEKWIIKKNYEIYFTFNSLFDLYKNLNEFKEWLSKEKVEERLLHYNSMDLVFISIQIENINSIILPEPDQIPMRDDKYAKMENNALLQYFHQMSKISIDAIERGDRYFAKQRLPGIFKEIEHRGLNKLHIQ
jgi:hypothetical protein